MMTNRLDGGMDPLLVLALVGGPLSAVAAVRSARSFEEAEWREVGWHRGAVTCWLAAAAIAWVLLPFVAYYWASLRPELVRARQRRQRARLAFSRRG
jgi:hypothetical protein